MISCKEKDKRKEKKNLPRVPHVGMQTWMVVVRGCRWTQVCVPADGLQMGLMQIEADGFVDSVMHQTGSVQ